MQPNSNSTISLPGTPPPTGTVDITDVVAKMQQSFVSWGTAYVYGLEIATPGLEWVALPVISELDKEAVKEILTLLSKSAEMQSFFMNTAIRKASQAQDFVGTIDAKNKLPPTATQKEFEDAERVQMAAFRNFVLVTN